MEKTPAAPLEFRNFSVVSGGICVFVVVTSVSFLALLAAAGTYLTGFALAFPLIWIGVSSAEIYRCFWRRPMILGYEDRLVIQNAYSGETTVVFAEITRAKFYMMGKYDSENVELFAGDDSIALVPTQGRTDARSGKQLSDFLRDKIPAAKWKRLEK